MAEVAESQTPVTSGSDHPDPRWDRPALALLLTATAVFWCIGLGRNGWANAFYSAAVQAGTKSWKAFLFGSSDAANAITVDKPPAALWPMEIAARIFGVNTWSILLPQVLLGVASVALLYAIVKKQFGPGAGLIAGLVLALTPVATLMFRYNNPDALLVFVMIAAVWTLLRAVADGRTRWLVLCGALLGLGFLTKQLQVLLVIPALAMTYLIAGQPSRLLTRLAQLMAGLAATVATAGWWVLLVELWPADDRPYIGGSSNNSFLDLTFGYNGLGRLSGGEHSMPAGAPGPDPAGGGFHPFGQAGITRLFTGESGAQISWLLPAALILLVTGLIVYRRRTRTDRDRAQYLVWGGWLLGTAAVFSYMSGLFHDYYTVALAPAVAALVGIGSATLCRRREHVWAVGTLATVTLATGIWAWVLLSRTPDFVGWLRWIILGAAITAAVGLVAAGAHRTGLRNAAAVVAIAAALAGPLAYCIQTVNTTHTGGVITAGPQISGSGMPGFGPTQSPGSASEAKVSDALTQELSADAYSYTWVAAVPGSTEAAYYQLATDRPVMALGGFGSGDPAPTLQQFQQYVADGRIHYYIPSAGLGLPGRPGEGSHGQSPAPPGRDGSSEAEHIEDWVKQHFTAIDVDGVAVYDLS
ncbi:glycosyl transferase [Mycobacterium sp. E802]|uniref:ArnT family glycosyltransferase n=1 Tax=Mycobacterium sp. E802 TaxID=1834152 RepID=UPI00080162F0|nr:glycosyltransferase family 39 protein [Mycobacterium sp. E802]OBG80263.1 glycosyl transferase [Mycobacterium sp. E802]